jgi:Thioredoxin-like
MYQSLKVAYPSHGLEIVFVSSDRDNASFTSYFDSMPWLAIPFDSLDQFKPTLSEMYGVKGIPSLVVLDSISGQVVVQNSETRQQITNASNCGDVAIKSMFENYWLPGVPPDSKQLLEMLIASCKDENSGSGAAALTLPLHRDYFICAEFRNKESRVKSLTAEFMAEGMEQGEATEAALSVEEASADFAELVQSSGDLDGVFDFTVLSNQSKCELSEGSIGKKEYLSVLSIVAKYVSNCMKSPWTVKFRHIRLSFKVVDDQITRVTGSLRAISTFGLEVFCSGDDFVLSIPVYADVNAIHDAITEKISKLPPLSCGCAVRTLLPERSSEV